MSFFSRSKNNPVITPKENLPWTNSQVYNPTVLYEDDKFHLFFRAVGGAWVSKIGYAVSNDGESFTISKHPVLEPDFQIEKNGIEDPRISKINDKYFLTYTAFDGETARLCLATSDNLKTFKKYGEFFPNLDTEKIGEFLVPWDAAQKWNLAIGHWYKAGGIFPGVINNKYYMLFGDRHIWLSKSSDGLKWHEPKKPFLSPRKDHFDSVHIEMGPAPIKTKEGWLVLYHGVDETITYRLGFVLLDLKNPSKIIFRSKNAIFEPEEDYELSGIVDILPGGQAALESMNKIELERVIDKHKNNKTLPSVIFCNGACLVGKVLHIYYGGADSVVCRADTEIKNIFNLLKK